MRKLIGLLSVVVVMGLVATGGAWLATRNQHSELAAAVDSLNPLVQRQTSYVKTVAPTSYDDHGTPEYVQVAVDAKGHQRTIAFCGMKTFTQDRYLAIAHKGAYVETYEAVPAEAVPAAAMAKLNNN